MEHSDCSNCQLTYVKYEKGGYLKATFCYVILFKLIITTSKNKNIMKLKNEFSTIKFENKDGIETKYETLFQTVKDELINVYIKYFAKFAEGMFTDHTKNSIVCEIMEHHKDSIEQEDYVIVALHIMNMLCTLIHSLKYKNIYKDI